MAAEIARLRQEAELLRAVTVEKGVLGRTLNEAAWGRVSRALNLPVTTVKYVQFMTIVVRYEVSFC